VGRDVHAAATQLAEVRGRSVRRRARSETGTRIAHVRVVRALRASFFACALTAACTQTTEVTHAIVVLANVDSAVGLTASDGYLYWVNLGAPWSIERIAETGGAVETVATSPVQPMDFAVSGALVYWTAVDGALRSAPVTGTSAPTVVASQLPGAWNLAIAGGAAYLGVGATSASDGTLLRVALGGGAPTVVLSGEIAPVLGDGTDVHFVSHGADLPAGVVYRYAAGDAAPTALYGPSPVSSIAVAAGFLYACVDEHSSSTLVDIVSIPLGGGPPATLVKGVERGFVVAASGVVAWWTPTSVWAVPDQGGTPTQLAQDAVTELAVDGDGVFGIDSTPRTGARIVVLR
jgi:hypothetical protein